MVKITKSYEMSAIPISLRPAFKENFAPRNIHRSAQTTSKRRHELIRAGAYNDIDLYNSRYKLSDIKKALTAIYKNKCAFCEQRVEQFHVEHYRSKHSYPWLAFSWDNHLCACDDCNQYKGIKFRINGHKATFVISLASIKNINSLSRDYDASEQPDLVNPEVTDPQGILVFQKDGSVSSLDSRFQYTITTCHIDRDYLNLYRSKILNDLRRDLKDAFTDNTAILSQQAAIAAIISKFINDAKDTANEFLAFRKYAIDHWLKQEIKAVLK